MAEEKTREAGNRRRNIIGAVLAAALVLVALIAVLIPKSEPRTAPSGSEAPAPSAAAGTSAPTASGGPAPSSAPPSTATTAPAPTAQPTRAQTVLASLSLEQRVGQIMMIGTPVAGADGATVDALRRLHLGNVFLKGRTTAGAAAVAGVTGALAAEATMAATRGVRHFVATDQEGGQVQIMRGPGFSEIPSAVAQGAMEPAALRAAAGVWGRELAAAGVNVNLAPVLDTVPSPGFAAHNVPIGRYGRQYGYTPESVSAHGLAFGQGMADAGVAATPKHFPGLGRVTANTDTATGVTDPTTTRTDPYIAPFRDAVRAGAPWMMISNAHYPAIDPDHYAVFSRTVITDMLRGDLGFGGVIVSDDVCDAKQLSGVPAENRGADFVAAGGTMVLCTNQGMAPRLWAGIVERARSDPAFATVVDAAALNVLQAKEAAGLLP